MRKKFDVEAYLDACADGDRIIDFCHENNISNFSELVESKILFPEECKDTWFKRLCSPGFIRYLHSKGIR